MSGGNTRRSAFSPTWECWPLSYNGPLIPLPRTNKPDCRNIVSESLSGSRMRYPWLVPGSFSVVTPEPTTQDSSNSASWKPSLAYAQPMSPEGIFLQALRGPRCEGVHLVGGRSPKGTLAQFIDALCVTARDPTMLPNERTFV